MSTNSKFLYFLKQEFLKHSFFCNFFTFFIICNQKYFFQIIHQRIFENKNNIPRFENYNMDQVSTKLYVTHFDQQRKRRA